MVYLFGNLVKDQKAKTKFREFRGFSKILFFSCYLLNVAWIQNYLV